MANAQHAQQQLQDNMFWAEKVTRRLQYLVEEVQRRNHPHNSFVQAARNVAFLSSSIEWLNAVHGEFDERSRSIAHALSVLNFFDRMRCRKIASSWEELESALRMSLGQLQRMFPEGLERLEAELASVTVAGRSEPEETTSSEAEPEEGTPPGEYTDPVASACALLGIDEEWSFDSARNVVKGLRVGYHPDKHMKDVGARRVLEQRLQVINQAWETLKAAKGWRD